MKNQLQNIAMLPFIYLSMAKELLHQRKFMQKTIVNDIEAIKKDIDGSLSDTDFKKITNYYAYAVPAILGKGFSILRGQPMTIKERTALTYLGAMTGLFDDFFDDKNASEDHIKTLLDHPNEDSASNSHELLFLRFCNKVLAVEKDRNFLNFYVNKVFEAQVLSKKQKLAAIGRDEIKTITIQKGGNSLLLYRSVLEESADAMEEKMTYKLGGLFQLENDIFDIYKDSIAGISTLATTESKIDNLRKEYSILMNETFHLVCQTNFPKKNQTKFLRFISLVIIRGFVCLDKLEENEKSTNNIFSIQKYMRSDLICDMEKIKSYVSLIGYYSKLKI